MKSKILILDTSVLCVFLDIPDWNTCDGEIKLNHELAVKEIDERKKAGWKFVLPVACVIETGNHIVHCKGDKYHLAKLLIELIIAALEGKSPWIVFTENLEIWKLTNIKWLIGWADHAVAGLSLADKTIAYIADDYFRNGFEVEIFTCDQPLKAYQPTPPPMTPRRRQ